MLRCWLLADLQSSDLLKRVLIVIASSLYCGNKNVRSGRTPLILEPIFTLEPQATLPCLDLCSCNWVGVGQLERKQESEPALILDAVNTWDKRKCAPLGENDIKDKHSTVEVGGR